MEQTRTLVVVLEVGNVHPNVDLSEERFADIIGNHIANIIKGTSLPAGLRGNVRRATWDGVTHNAPTTQNNGVVRLAPSEYDADATISM